MALPGAPAPPERRAAVLIACAALIAATIVAYSNTLRCPFVLDDTNDIVHNRSLRHLWPPWRPLLVELPGKIALQGRPVANWSLAVNYAFAGLDPRAYHLTNLAIHALGALVLFGIVRRLLESPKVAERYRRLAVPLGFVVAGLWALHPLQTQAVTYVIQRYESLMGLFYLLAVYCAIRSEGAARPGWWMAGSVAACLFAVGCKEVAVSAPLVILLVDRALLAGSFREAWRRRWGMYLGLAGTWIVLAALLVLSSGRSQWAGFGLATTPLEYARSQPGVILHYLRLSFWPSPLVFDYYWPVARTAGAIIPGALVVGGLLAATVWALVRHPLWGTLGAWFFLILAPTSSIMPIADLAFEHRMYLPLAAVVAAAVIAGYGSLGWWLARLRLAERSIRHVQAACALAAIVALGIATHERNKVYRSELSVWNDVIQKAPHNPRAHNLLIMILGRQGKLDAAAEHCRRALEADPRFAHAPNSLGLMLLMHGKLDEAIAQFQKTLQIDPQYNRAYNNMGLALFRQGKLDAAADQFRKALDLDPHYGQAHHNLADVLMQQGNFDEAAAHYQKAIELDRENAGLHNNLGAALQRQGKLDEAIAHYQKALALDSQCVQARDNLANAERLRQRSKRP